MTAPHLPPSPTGPPRYTELASLPDEALMAHLRAGRHDALAVLFDRYHRLVLSVALRILRDAGEAEDLMQAVFLEVFQAAAQFDSAKGTTKVWILQYAYHRSFSRRKYLTLRGIYDHVGEDPPSERNPPPGAQGSLNVQESARLVQQALGRLNKIQREILEMAFFEGLTMHEIVQRTGESFGSVRHHYYRGLDKLRLLVCEERQGAGSTSTAGRRVTDVQP